MKGSRPRWRFIAAASLIVAALAIIGIGWIGHALTRPARSSAGPPPADLPIQQLQFSSRSGVRLSAWFVPGRKGAGAILLVHAIRSDKRALLPRARFLHAQGFSLLLLDLQAHGESEGDRIAFGARESFDVTAAIRELGRLAPGERLGALGASLGAAAIALSDAPASLSATVLESIYSTIDTAVANRLQMRLGAAGESLAPLLLWLLEPFLGVTPEELRPQDHVYRFRHPVLFVHGAADRHTTIKEARRVYAAVQATKDFYVVDGAPHGDLHRYAGVAYEQRVGEFFARYLRQP